MTIAQCIASASALRRGNGRDGRDGRSQSADGGISTRNSSRLNRTPRIGAGVFRHTLLATLKKTWAASNGAWSCYARAGRTCARSRSGAIDRYFSRRQMRKSPRYSRESLISLVLNSVASTLPLQLNSFSAWRASLYSTFEPLISLAVAFRLPFSGSRNLINEFSSRVTNRLKKRLVHQFTKLI